MKKPVMLILIGGRSAVPATMAGLQYVENVDRVKFLICEANDDRYLKAQKWTLESLKRQNPAVLCDETTDICKVDGNDFNKSWEKVKQLCSGDEIEVTYVSLTSAPQTMAFAVFDYIRQHYKNAFVFSVYTNDGCIVPLIRGKTGRKISKRLTVEDYISAYGLSIFKKDNVTDQFSCTEVQAQNVVEYIVKNLDTTENMLAVIRSNSGREKKIKNIKVGVKILERAIIATDTFEEFLRILKNSGIVKDYVQTLNTFVYTFSSPLDRSFLFGKWLEYYVYSEACNAGFDSVEAGIELSDYHGEIDVFCVHRANALICECKTPIGKNRNFTKLDSVAKKLGGSYCVKLFITSELNVDDKVIGRGKNKEIKLVTGNELPNVQEIFKKQMATPDFSRR
jgi:hypothetical protein